MDLRWASILFGSLSFLLTGCISGGTHGSIKTYQYPISKYALDSAVQKAMASNPNILMDTAKDYYNNEHTYVTMAIKQPDMTYRYTFRYAGDSTGWDTTRNMSELFISYAWDENGKGGSQGNGVSWFHWSLKRRLIKPFETEFILRLDSILKVKHTNPN